jgi:competence protein ComEA
LEPRVSETNAIRALLWTTVAVVAVLSVRAPAAPGALALVRDGSACRLGRAAGAPVCDCRALPADARAALGLPQGLNSASTAELERVPGLGPTRARAIAEERQRGGAFESLEALAQRVRGIGPKTVDRIRPYLFAVGPDPACEAGSRS